MTDFDPEAPPVIPRDVKSQPKKLSHNYFQKSFFTCISLKTPSFTRQSTHRNPFPANRFFGASCYVPIRERPYIVAHPDSFFLARKRRITVKLDFRFCSSST